MTSKAAVNRIIETLKGIYPDGLCSLQYKKDYELLFAVRLSAQCTDERVNKVTPALYARFPTLESFAEADPAEVGEYIHSCGFYNGKARDIVACAQKLVNEYGGRVPGTMEELTRLPRRGAQDRQSDSGGRVRPARLCLRHPLHPHHGTAGDHRRLQRSPSGGAAAAGADPSQGVQQLLPPDGAFSAGIPATARSPKCEGCPLAKDCDTAKARQTGLTALESLWNFTCLRNAQARFFVFPHILR